MIYCLLKGGLGNIMFQIAASKSIAIDNQTFVEFPNLKEHIQYLNQETNHRPELKHAGEYQMIFKELDFSNQSQAYVMQHIEHIEFNQLDVPFYKDVCYDGYFQSEQYFAHNREFILKMFEPSYFVLSNINRGYADLLKYNTCSIHVRRGDYLKFKDIHPVQDMKYFNKAMGAIGEVDKYLIFSDDINWCKENFIGDKFVFIEGERDYTDLFLISMCKHNIISNSSFSWWGAWLNTNEFKRVVAPLNWFTNNCMPSENIIPSNWIKL